MLRKILTICSVVSLRITSTAFAQCGDPQAGDCCSAHDTPHCADIACCEGICQNDPFCCDEPWDEICAEEAQPICDICGGVCGFPAAGSCCEANPTVGCDDIACCAIVCLIASNCCALEWDEFCADLAASFCSELCCPQDLDGDGLVDAFDLAMLLAAWGLCSGCVADLDLDGDIDSADLAELLAAWGACP